jgi:hypothetical protein
LNELGSRRLGEPAPAATSCAFRWRDCPHHRDRHVHRLPDRRAEITFDFQTA